uniref:NF-X1-type zinc finger protein NFXL1 n=1 Tax=Anthurium amnicola TaxID=1678845 RepID=A0A1D1XW12_9ARAE
MEQHGLPGRRKEGNGNPSPRRRRGQLRNGVLARFFGSPAALVRACTGKRGGATKNARVERLPPARKGPPAPPTPEESPTRKKVNRGDTILPGSPQALLSEPCSSGLLLLWGHLCLKDMHDHGGERTVGLHEEHGPWEEVLLPFLLELSGGERE